MTRWLRFVKLAILLAILAAAGPQNTILPLPDASAESRWISGHISFGAAAATWSAWDQASESTLNTDQDSNGTADTNICFMENTVAGGNETSVGVLTGANLVFTQAGNLSGAVGTPPTRSFVGANMGISGTATFSQTMLIDAAGWLCLIKTTLVAHESGAHLLYHTGGNDMVRIYMNAGNTLRFTVDVDGARNLDASTTDAYVSGTEYYVAVWYNAASGVIRGGFTTTKPTAWSSFPANKRVTASAAAAFDVSDFGSAPAFMYDGGAICVQGACKYVIHTMVPGSFINDAG